MTTRWASDCHQETPTTPSPTPLSWTGPHWTCTTVMMRLRWKDQFRSHNRCPVNTPTIAYFHIISSWVELSSSIKVSQLNVGFIFFFRFSILINVELLIVPFLSECPLSDQGYLGKSAVWHFSVSPLRCGGEPQTGGHCGDVDSGKFADSPAGYRAGSWEREERGLQFVMISWAHLSNIKQRPTSTMAGPVTWRAPDWNPLSPTPREQLVSQSVSIMYNV